MTLTNPGMESASAADACEFVISREFDAPRELVWKAWSEPERLAQWWGPKGFTLTVIQLDFRPQGIFHYRMQGANGFAMWGRFVYGEITAPERMVFVNSFSDEDGQVIRSPFSDTWPLEVHNTLTLQEQNGKTTLTLRGGPLNATEVERKAFQDGHDSMRQGFGGTFDQLADYLAQAPR